MFHAKVKGRIFQILGIDYITSGSVGLQIDFEFDDEWTGLERYATFEAGSVSISVELENNACVIPWEVLEDPNVNLRIGIRGSNGDDVVIPTIWREYEIHEGAKFSEDSGSPASLNVIEQLSARMDILEENGGVDIFWATYGQTSFDDVYQQADIHHRLVACMYNDRIYILQKDSSFGGVSSYTFYAPDFDQTNISIYWVKVDEEDFWTNGYKSSSGEGGGGSDDTYEVTYGTTTTADINTAASAGKLCYCVYNGRTYYLMSWTYTALVRAAKFYAIVSTSELYYVSVSGESYWANGTETIAGNKADKVTITTVSTAGSVSQALDAGKIYDFTGALTDLTITLNSATAPAQYHFRFDSGSTAPTLTLPQTVTMQSGFQVEANKHYEIDILDDYGVVQSW